MYLARHICIHVYMYIQRELSCCPLAGMQERDMLYTNTRTHTDGKVETGGFLYRTLFWLGSERGFFLFF